MSKINLGLEGKTVTLRFGDKATGVTVLGWECPTKKKAKLRFSALSDAVVHGAGIVSFVDQSKDPVGAKIDVGLSYLTLAVVEALGIGQEPPDIESILGDAGFTSNLQAALNAAEEDVGEREVALTNASERIAALEAENAELRERNAAVEAELAAARSIQLRRVIDTVEAVAEVLAGGNPGGEEAPSIPADASSDVALTSGQDDVNAAQVA